LYPGHYPLSGIVIMYTIFRGSVPQLKKNKETEKIPTL